ncbi:MAG: family 16 glycoside hydrolase [bacterium]
MIRRALACMLVVTLAPVANAQARAETNAEFPPQLISLANLNAFRPTSANWRIAGAATADRDHSRALTGAAGTGVLVNAPSAAAKAPLFTTWEHGDIDVEFDVMLAKGSSAGLYLMGRYDVQLADSWGVRTPTVADLGAIGQRWDAKQSAGFEGTPPRQNASRAPGLWQHVEISFRAPRFDGQRKTADARFAKVTVNGAVMQDNVRVTGPTQGAAFQDERPFGPLMIEGDHGPIAFRNVRYKSYTGSVKLTALRYRVFEGEPMDSAYAATHTPVREGVATAFSSDLAATPDKFAISYDGTLNAPSAGLYRFQLDLGWIGNDSASRGGRIGGGTLTIDGMPALVHRGAERRASADTKLSAGAHPFTVTYYKNRPAFNRRDVALWVEGPGVERQALHDESVAINFGPAINPIVVEPEMEPVVLRSFVRHHDSKRVIAVSVADPLGVHYSYDLAQGALLYVWRGPFLETTQMWHERGEDQTAEPLGGAITLPGTPSIAVLANANAAWPDSMDERKFRRDGYSLDKSGHPTFLSHLGGVAVEDDIRPASDGFSLRRELRLKAPATGAVTVGLYVQLAQGDHIARESDGSYVIGDRSFYITLPGGRASAVIRRQNGRDELLVPVKFANGAASVVYNIVW